jgi:subtilase family serine protease
MGATKRFVTRSALVGVSVVTVVASGLVGVSPAAAATPDTAHRIKVHPDIVRVAKAGNAVHFSCQDRPIDGSAGPRCYQPSQIQAAYGLTPLLNKGINGSGRTIVIVDAYQNPYITTDLAVFDSTFGLPNPAFTQIAPQGLTPFDVNDPNMDGWAEEITLDVLWAHAVAPGAHIVLALAKSNNDTDIYNTTKYVIDHNVGDVISQSFGEAEACMDPQLLAKQHKLFEQAQHKQITVFASSGDSGASQFSCDGSSAILAASTPASDPLVTGVGGTTLNADATTGAYLGETAWTENLFGCNPPSVDVADINCSGGGFSTIYSRPAFQSKTQSRKLGRGVPDVAYDAGINGGVLTHCGICNVLIGLNPADPAFFLFGGTSAGSPQWAGMVAVGDQLAHRRFGDINPTLYAISRSKALYGASLHDVKIGNNDVAEIGTGYDTAKGWDPVTGLGTPNASRLLPLLAIAANLR